jgi:pyruvate formate lyase activating enzyme
MNRILIKGFLETLFLDWPGKIVSVVFLPFCNFRCPYCQNAKLILQPHLLKTIPESYILKRLEAFEGWIDGICITGGEPTLHKGLPDLITIFKQRGFLVKLDTNGSNPSMVKNLLDRNLVDCIAMDVKAPLENSLYAPLIGTTFDVNKLKESIGMIRNSGIETIFRLTVVPNLLTEEDIYRVAGELAPVKKFTLQQFSPENSLEPALRDISPWPQKKLDRVQQRVDEIIAGDNG